VFSNGADLAAHIRTVLGDEDWAKDMAAKGRQYVLSEYSWPVVLDRLEADLGELADRR
jgi:glycosyltransferase involved in cell wall biosynthesis